jgi:hypothetical protein
MNIERIRNIKKYSLLIVGALFVTIPFILARSNPAFRTTSGMVIYFLEIFNLLVICWLFYLISEIDLIKQGKIGKSLIFIVSGLIIFAVQATFVCMGDLEIPFFKEIGNFLIQPIVLSVLQTIILILLVVGIVNLAKLYRK